MQWQLSAYLKYNPLYAIASHPICKLLLYPFILVIYYISIQVATFSGFSMKQIDIVVLLITAGNWQSRCSSNNIIEIITWNWNENVN